MAGQDCSALTWTHPLAVNGVAEPQGLLDDELITVPAAATGRWK
ncbi:hypothetical protein [Azospirillum endophyticum]